MTETVESAPCSTGCTYTGTYKIWQYTGSGRVSGISGNVDMNYMYGELPWADTAPPDPATHDYSGTYYVAAQRSSGNYYYLSNDLDAQYHKRYMAVDSGTTTLPDSINGNLNADLVWNLTRVSGSTYKLSAPYNHGSSYAGWAMSEVDDTVRIAPHLSPPCQRGRFHSPSITYPLPMMFRQGVFAALRW